MSQSYLPIELWHQIAAEEILDLRDHHSLTLVSREFNSLFTPVLYAKINIDLNHKAPEFQVSSKSQFYGVRQQGLLKVLESSAKHQSYIRSIYLFDRQDQTFGKRKKRKKGEVPQKKTFRNLTPTVLAIFTACPNLRSVHFNLISLTTDDIFHLGTRPSPGLSITIEECQISGEQSGHALFTATALRCPEGDIIKLYPLIYGGSLERLEVTYSRAWGPLSLAQIGTTPTSQPTLGLLKHLDLPFVQNDVIHFFKATPNIVSLAIKGLDNPTKFTDCEAWRRVLPKLELIIGPTDIFPLLLFGRSVTSLVSLKPGYLSPSPYPDFDFLSAGSNFGSIAPIRNIYWRKYHDLSEILSYITDKCPFVEVFEFSSLVGSLSQEQLQSHINQVKRLKHLRELVITRQVTKDRRRPTWEELLWEEAQCKALCDEGCPNLILFTFPSWMTWTRRPSKDDWKGDYKWKEWGY